MSEYEKKTVDTEVTENETVEGKAEEKTVAETVSYKSKEKAKVVRQEQNKVAVILKILGIVVIGIGIIAGFMAANVSMGVYNAFGEDEILGSGFSFGIALSYWVKALVAGMVLIGLGEIIELLEGIKRCIGKE